MSSLAFLLFQVRKDMVRAIKMGEARLALQAASIRTGPGGGPQTNIVLDETDYYWRDDLADFAPPLVGQITVAVPLPFDAHKSEAFLESFGLADPTTNTRGRFVIRQARLFASTQNGSTIVMTSVPLSALTAGLSGRIAIDVAGVCFLGLLLLLVES